MNQKIKGGIRGGQNAHTVQGDQTYIENLNKQTKILQKIFNTLNYNQQTININYGSLTNTAELKDGKSIGIRPISNGLLLILNYFAFFYISALLIVLYGIALQYIGSNNTMLNITSVNHKVILGFEYLFLFFIGYYTLFIVIQYISNWTNKKYLTEKDFDGIEFKRIRRIRLDKKSLYQEVAIYTIDQLKPHTYILNHHDYWMIRDLWEAWLYSHAEKKLLESS
ncbi:hypothetical protein KKH82_01135 [Patescibacteria group bacterium]|nr:hypothetical protein [Patescibacteria group bacterium]